MADKKHTYDYRISLDGATAPARAIRMIGSNKRVLEIGAGPGSITRVLTSNYGCEVTALEYDETAIEHLKPCCRKVFQADLNDPTWPTLLDNEPGHDVVVCTDVLEHLYNPLATLVAMKKFLRPETYMVISLPNIGHLATFACLYDSDFRYSEFGLLDKTHIRFFSIKNIQALLSEAGLKITEVEFVTLRPEETELAEPWRRLPASLQKELTKSPFGMVYQVVLKAVLNDSPGEAVDILNTPVPPMPKPSLLMLAKRLAKRLLGAKGVAFIKSTVYLFETTSRKHK